MLPTTSVRRNTDRRYFPISSLILSEIKKTNHRRSYKRQRVAKFFFSRENITNGIHPSAFSMVITGGLSVGDGGMTVNVSELYQIPTDIFRR
jgi:hypothetical protein